MFCGVADVSSVRVFIFTSEVGLSIDTSEWTLVLRTVTFYSPRKQGSFVRILISVVAYRTCNGPITHPRISNKSIYARVIKTESGRPWAYAIFISVQWEKRQFQFMQERAFTKITCLIFTSACQMRYIGCVRLKFLKSVAINNQTAQPTTKSIAD